MKPVAMREWNHGRCYSMKPVAMRQWCSQEMLIWHSSRHRKYLPVLKNFPTRYIHEPWNAPEAVQKAAKCIVGKEYSLPMVNHAVVSRINMERMKQVYQHLAKYRDSVANMCVFIPSNAVGLGKEPFKRTVTPPFTPQGAIITHRAYEFDTVRFHTPPNPNGRTRGAQDCQPAVLCPNPKNTPQGTDCLGDFVQTPKIETGHIKEEVPSGLSQQGED
uniref:Cryptochrome/DNA photolyase FAD-binding domain-containing protein n=1 Tax=Timema douglasi TaxID=61478 RepID=A0A7R8ZDU8_TIMDO|nr:unnamed protein product [Timema douglasi]